MAEVSPELIKLAENIKPQIELELKKRGIPLMADLSNSQMNEIIKRAPAISNRLDALMQPVGSTGIESMMMNVLGPGKFTKINKLLPTNLLDDILPAMQKVFKEFNKLTGKDKTEAAEFLKPKIADLTARAKRTQTIEDADPMFTGSGILNKNVIALEQFDDILKNVPKATTFKSKSRKYTRSASPDMAEIVGESYMRKSNLAKGGLLSALDRIKSNT
tara:strand:+ start:374 stop:1027 length:654 start_codon:yes stop_codon:yes gene_type:complete